MSRKLLSVGLLTLIVNAAAAAPNPALPLATTALTPTEAFAAAVRNLPNISPSEAYGIWPPPTPAIPKANPAFQSSEGRALLRNELLANAKPNGSLERQAVALAYLAVKPTEAEVAQVKSMLSQKSIWEPWRAALVIAAFGDQSQFPTLSALLAEQPAGWPGGQTTLAIGLLGNSAGAPVLEDYLRKRYGTREYNLAKEALILLGRKGPAQAESVTQAAVSLLTVRETGLLKVDAITWQLDHPERLESLQSTALDILRAVGTNAGIAAIQAEIPRFRKTSEALIRFARESIDVIRSRLQAPKQ